MNVAIQMRLGASVEANAAADGGDYAWMQEFRETPGLIAPSLRTEVIGFAAVLDNLSAVADAGRRPIIMPIAGVVYLLLLWFIAPGIIHRLAIAHPVGARGFFATCGAFAFRMLRLSIATAVVYGLLFGVFHPWLFDDLFEQLTRDTTAERNAFMLRVSFYALFFLVAAGVNLLFDYVKVRMVVEDRYSVFAALTAAARFVRGHRGLAAGVYAMNVLTLAAVVAAYGLIAPGAGTAGWDMWAALLAGELYIAARLFVKLSFWGGAIVAVQNELGHFGFARSALEVRWVG
jgi:hypothetical protein